MYIGKKEIIKIFNFGIEIYLPKFLYLYFIENLYGINMPLTLENGEYKN